MKFEKGSPEFLTPENLVPSENLDSRLTFAIDPETDIAEERILGRAFWIKLISNQGQAEGKLYTPESGRPANLVLFEPGMPGNSVKWMEEKHTAAILRQGSALMVMRHLGTRLSPQVPETDQNATTNKYIHCPQRIGKNPEDYYPVIGGSKQPYKMRDLAQEAAVALNILGKQFINIKVVGHSLGALYLSDSLNRLDPDIRDRATHFLSLAGAPGGLKETTPKIADYRTYLHQCQKYINLENPDAAMNGIDEITAEIEKIGIPKNIMVTLVGSSSDEYLPLSAMKTFQNLINRGLIINDYTQTEEEFHDLKNLRPETLLRLLNLPPRPQKKSETTFRREQPKK